MHQAAPSPLRGTLPPPGGQDATLPQVPWWVRSGTLVWGAPQAQLQVSPPSRPLPLPTKTQRLRGPCSELSQDPGPKEPGHAGAPGPGPDDHWGSLSPDSALWPLCPHWASLSSQTTVLWFLWPVTPFPLQGSSSPGPGHQCLDSQGLGCQATEMHISSRPRPRPAPSAPVPPPRKLMPSLSTQPGGRTPSQCAQARPREGGLPLKATELIPCR